jgi:hypothetical protein
MAIGGVLFPWRRKQCFTPLPFSPPIYNPVTVWGWGPPTYRFNPPECYIFLYYPVYLYTVAMTANEYHALKARFLKLYANVPMPLRGEIVAVVDDEPFTWASARAEILHDTAKSEKILQQLNNLRVL